MTSTRRWLSLELWSGSSINTVVGGANLTDLPLPALLGLAAAIATATTLLLARWRPAWFGPRLPVALAMMFLGAWFALDARWQWNLAQQVHATRDKYAGKNWREKHIASEDGPLFTFIEKARAKLPPPPARVFMFADSHYFRGRGAYHLYPYNVYFDPLVNSPLPRRRLRAGDYVLVYHRRGVQYDAAQQRLRWDNNAPITADLLLVDSGAALLRIRCGISSPLVAGLLLPWLPGIAVLVVMPPTGGRSRRLAKLPGSPAPVTSSALSCSRYGCECSRSPTCVSVFSHRSPPRCSCGPCWPTSLATVRFLFSLQPRPPPRDLLTLARALLARGVSCGGLRFAMVSLRFFLLALEVTCVRSTRGTHGSNGRPRRESGTSYGQIAPFARAQEWFSADGSVYFDASPEVPAYHAPAAGVVVPAAWALGRRAHELAVVASRRRARALVYGGAAAARLEPPSALAARFSSRRCRSPTSTSRLPATPTFRWPPTTPARRSRCSAGR